MMNNTIQAFRFFCALLLLVSVRLQAQDLVFSTELSAKQIGLDEPLQVTYAIKNASSVSKFFEPSFSGFRKVAGPMQSSSVNIINGSMNSAINITFVLKPTQAGVFTIPGAKAICENGTIKSNDVQVQVLNGASGQKKQQPTKQNPVIVNPFDDDIFKDPFDDPFFKRFFPNRSRQLPQQKNQGSGSASNNLTSSNINDKIFAKIDVSKNKAYLGEPIIVTYNVYSQIPISIKPLMPTGSPKGFWLKDIEFDVNAYKERTKINGKEYLIIPIRKFAVIPTQYGNLYLDSFKVEGFAEASNQGNGGSSLSDFIDDIFSQPQQIPFELNASKLNIEVKPLPEAGKPENFSGAVGNFSIESTIDKTELNTDQALSLQYVIKGNGNINMMGAPHISFPDALENYPPKIFDTITHANTTLNGYKIYKYYLTPKQTGTVTIPASSFSYFDPESESYKSISTPSYTLKVKPGKNFDDLVAQNKLNDIHDIEISEPEKQYGSNLWIEKPWYWLAIALPLVLMLAFTFFKQKKPTLSKAEIKNKSAQKTAKARLQNAERLLQAQDFAGFYKETANLTWLYLSDKLNIAFAKLSKDIVVQRLDSLQVDKTLQSNVFNLIDQCESALYAQQTDSNAPQQVYVQAVDVISKLEEKLA